MTDATSPVLHLFEDYHVQITELTETDIAFVVSEISSRSEDGIKVFYPFTDDDSPAFTETENFAEAERVLSGNIVWDGTSNWDFHTDDCMAQFCGRKHATGIGRLMDFLYDMAAQRVVAWDAKLAE